MFSEFYILHKKNPAGAEVLPSQVQCTFKTCLRLMGFVWLSEGETLNSTKGFEVFRGVEAYQFLQSIVDGQQREPSFASALALANVQKAMKAG